jgi:peptidoglycan/LPS O-acetylase OafA/YrhL
MIKKLKYIPIILILFTPFFLSLSIFNYSNTELPSEDFINYEPCMYDINDLLNSLDYQNIDYKILPIEMSIYPEVKNLKCINKVLIINQGDTYSVGVGTSTTFYTLSRGLLLIALSISWIMLKRKNLVEVIILNILLNYIYSEIFLFHKISFSILMISIFTVLFIFYSGKNIKINSVKRINYRSDINLLRAISVLLVVIYHADFGYLQGGWLGVDLFFVISGYLISNIIISELNLRTFSFQNFYLRRVRRILPALFSVLTITSFFSYLTLYPKQMIIFSESLRSSIFFYSNYFFRIFDFYTTSSAKSLSLLHTWSLAIEEQFYFLFPVVTYLIFKHYKKDFFPFLIVVSSWSLYSNFNSLIISDKFYNFELRIWEILFGVIVMIISFQEKKISNKYLYYFSFFSLFVVPLMIVEESINQIYPRILIIILISFILLCAENERFKVIKSISQNKLLTNLGLTSYSIYLIHQPFFAFAINYFERRDIEFSIFLKLISLCVVFILANLNYRYIESYFLNKERNFLFLMPVLFALLTFSYFADRTSGFINRYSEIPDKIVNYSVNGFEFNIDNNDCQNSTIENICIFYSSNSDVNVIGIGDSHLSEIGKYLSENNNNFNYIHIGENGCIFSVNKIPNNACVNKDLSELKQFISSYENSYIVLSSRWENYINFYDSRDFNIYDELLKTFEFLLSNNNKIILIGAIPEQEINIIDEYLNKKINFGDLVYVEKETWLNRSFKANNFFESLNQPDIKFIDTVDIFCNKIITDKCVGAVNDKVYYFDNNHLTEEGAELIGKELLIYINSEPES